jgi:Inhibitor of growth proteins N-terminal histone-binding
MMSSSDETYLEAFIEKLTTLPHQLRRNLDLLKDLDGSSSDDLHKLRKLQREYILAAEEKMMQLEVVEMEPADDVDDNEDSEMDDEPKTKKCPVYGVRVLNEDGTSSPDNPVVVPTTEEFMEYITYNTANNANAAASYQQIRKLQHDCLQKADEKVAVAQQAYEMMDAQVQRLDADLAAMEQLLQVRVSMCLLQCSMLYCAFREL